ncbi:MAG: phosphoribosylformylglycinamidine synthase subunit PurL [Candidatus Krumholzibacteria bacterium]|nr:phosphoribosylformylglycinamidine synthase subunit PurL [Candidatus Krumholzibacteria bacterium]MDH4336537.1 phosphoribosylformylglycinamidine synthase subunit PurL [Candidatus Krumholzibacteria bacterium]MDH5269618.1 phosphoribosylformylglycinamidine synthase subunit PurL [Candidatus Krumholzibacteria bacterium]
MIDPKDLVPADPNDAGAAKDFLKKNGVSLSPGEYARVCELLGRRPTIVELHMFNVMWSEHCSYKSSRWALKEYLPTDAPHVVLGPGEDAGIIRFCEAGGKSWCLVMAHESHNHPSQVLPVEGAATGIGGIVRDVYCMGADVIGVMDPLRFGDPDGPNAAHVRDIAFGVVEGIAQYGNALGVPNYGGETYFDASFDDNCLVNVVAFGIVEEGGIIRSRVPEEARHVPYDLILVGKPTDASGFGGAAFASERLDGSSAVEKQGAVQVPDPFVKRVLAEAIREMLKFARENKIPIGFKDLGAGGIACAFSEMPEASRFGARIDLDKVNKAFPDLLPEVIACSETQERFAIAVPTRVTRDILAIFNQKFEMPRLYTGAGAVHIGRVTDDYRFSITHQGRVVCEAAMDAVTSGISYRREQKEQRRSIKPGAHRRGAGVDGMKDALLTLLASVNIADKAAIYQHYDTEVQARAVIRPGEADAAVEIFVPGQPFGLAVAVGGHSRIGLLDPYAGGAWSVFEATRNVACVGALPLAVTDCLNFGDPEDPGVFNEFVECVKGIGDACRAMKLFGGDHPLPIVSGNVSLYNQSGTGDAIAPTPIVACAGRLDDASRARGFALKQVGSSLVLLGRLHEDLGGSEFERVFGNGGHAKAPVPDFAFELALVKALNAAFAKRLVLAAHDISLGGLLVTVAEMAIASEPFDIGASLDLRGASDLACFSEMGGVVIEAGEGSWEELKPLLDKHGVGYIEIGRTAADVGLKAALADGTFTATVNELRTAHTGRLAEILYG